MISSILKKLLMYVVLCKEKYATIEKDNMLNREEQQAFLQEKESP